MALSRVCNGCGRIFPQDGKPRCPDCRRAKERRRDRTTPNAKAYRGVGELGRAWRRERAAYLHAHPICEWPEGCIEEAGHVHHKDGEGPAGARGLDHANFMAVCASHHGQIEARRHVRGPDGKWTSRKLVEPE